MPTVKSEVMLEVDQRKKSDSQEVAMNEAEWQAVSAFAAAQGKKTGQLVRELALAAINFKPS